MKVRLKQNPSNEMIYINLSFNSMKVRLKHIKETGGKSVEIRFQFHEGPIKT